MKRARREWIGYGAIALLWVSCLTPASLGGSNLTSFDVYLYNGLYGTCHAEGGWGWKTKDSIKGYTLIMANAPCTGIRAGVTNAYPLGYSAPSGYVLESDAGILAVPTGTSTNDWQWNSELYETGVNMKCGLLSTYSPYPKYWDEDRNDGCANDQIMRLKIA